MLEHWAGRLWRLVIGWVWPWKPDVQGGATVGELLNFQSHVALRASVSSSPRQAGLPATAQ